jgi:hypothetical protein
VIEFLIKIEASSFLFSNVMDLLKEQGELDNFFESIEKFIEKKKLRIISNEALSQIINYFTENNQLQVIQTLILNLDLEKIDISPIIKVCLDQNLFRPLIFISTTHNKDFLTPLIKIFALYENK